MKIKYWNASGSGFPPSLIPALRNIGILHHKKTKLPKHLQHSVCLLKFSFFRKFFQSYTFVEGFSVLSTKSREAKSLWFYSSEKMFFFTYDRLWDLFILVCTADKQNASI